MRIVSSKHPALRTVSEEVLDPISVHRLLDRMWELMEANDGMGLAANQVGVAKRVIILSIGTFKQEIINPVTTKKFGGMGTSKEGCLSYPGLEVKKARYRRITVEGVDRNGKAVRFNLKGLAAYCGQHEVDHLNGITIG